MVKCRKKQIYIIGDIPQIIDLEVINKFKNAQRELEVCGCIAINPITTFLNTDLSREEVLDKNLKLLFRSTMVYILNDYNSDIHNCIDLKIALKLNHTVVHQPIYMIEEEDILDVILEKYSALILEPSIR